MEIKNTQSDNKMKHKHIHYLMTHGIGDIVTVVPVLKRISEFPHFSLSITAKSRIEADVITSLCPEVDIKFIYFQEILKSRGLIISFLNLIRRIRKLNPDIIIAQYGVNPIKSSLLSLLSGAKIRIGWRGPLSFLNTTTIIPIGLHKIDENIKVLKSIDINTDDLLASYPKYSSVGINFNQTYINELLSRNSLKIVISPGSGEEEKHKRWPKKNFSSLINLILSGRNNVSVFLVGSQAEKELCEEIKQNSDNKISIHNLAGKTSIKELLELLSRADLTITNCNGVSHLACTTNSPIIGLYGPTDYRITGPKSSSFIPVTAGLECAPCYAKDYITGCGNPICMEAIKVQDVVKLVNGLL
ncbi:hypothetical protein ES705_11504 [subsurface metagenome]